jgi:hypothetical protein
MISRNRADRTVQATRRAAALALRGAGLSPAQNAGGSADPTLAAQVGGNDAVTGEWTPYGILGVTLAEQAFRLKDG